MNQDQPLAPLPSITLGVYQHYKGGLYALIGVARHSETQDALAVYRPLYNDSGLWVRPLAMFLENVRVQGQDVPRFQFLRETTESALTENGPQKS